MVIGNASHSSPLGSLEQAFPIPSPELPDSPTPSAAAKPPHPLRFLNPGPFNRHFVASVSHLFTLSSSTCFLRTSDVPEAAQPLQKPSPVNPGIWILPSLKGTCMAKSRAKQLGPVSTLSACIAFVLSPDSTGHEMLPFSGYMKAPQNLHPLRTCEQDLIRKQDLCIWDEVQDLR